MRKEEIMKITNKELVKLLGIEQLEWFRRKMYKYKRRDLLFYNVEFHLLSELKNVSDNTAGRYIYEETEEVHKIYILDRYINYYRNNYFSKNNWGRFRKNETIDTMRHEILHAYVKERFRYICKVDHCEADASIIFLMHLQFFKVTSGHDCAYSYRHSEIYKKVKECKEYEEFLDLVVDTIMNLNNIQNNLKDKYEDKSIKINFGSRNSSIYKFIQAKSKYIVKNEEKLKLIEVEAITFAIGSATPINRIEELITKKLKNREVAEIREIKKIYMKKNGEKIYSKEIVLDEAS